MGAERKVGTSDSSLQDQTVRECLEKILQSPAFRSSGRAKQFLSFVVLRTLEGRQDEIKERTIGAEVFGRTADFETSGDSIVRVNANEVRRRLAQYHTDATEPDPVQIVLPPGTYVPQFITHPAAPATDVRQSADPAQQAAPVSGVPHPRRAFVWVSGAVIGVLVVAAAIAVRPRPSNFERFWAPVLNLAAAPVLCLPATDTFQLAPDAADELSRVKPGGLLTRPVARCKASTTGIHRYRCFRPPSALPRCFNAKARQRSCGLELI